jgi:squalene synthase HpnC
VRLAEAYAACERLAAAHYENFPVASRLLPAHMRPHVAAVYAFARTADDFADEEGYTLAERHALLDDWHRRLVHAAGVSVVADTPDVKPIAPGRRASAVDPDAIFLAVADTIRTRSLEASLFEDLLSAFRQDTVVTRYPTWDDLFDYCRRSANPVGRLVLRIAGYRDDRLDRSSDALCTALQLTNFWQDLAVDWRRGRLYVPLAERDAAGAADADLDAARMTPAWQAALEHATLRTRELFELGRPLCDSVRGRLRHELRLTWLAATRVLDRLESSRFDVFRHRPSLTMADGPALAWRLARWRARAGT